MFLILLIFSFGRKYSGTAGFRLFASGQTRGSPREEKPCDSSQPPIRGIHVSCDRTITFYKMQFES